MGGEGVRGWGQNNKSGQRVQSCNELSIMQVRHNSRRKCKLSALEGTRIYSTSHSLN